MNPSRKSSCLILLPGLLCDAALWCAQRTVLEATVDVVVPDLARDDTIAAMAERVLAAMPERFALVGLSMGGYVALEIMARAPERVERLALIDTSARPDTDDQRRRREGLLKLADIGRFKGVTPRLMPLLVHAGRLDDAAVTGTILEMAERVGKDGFIRQQRAILGRRDFLPVLPTIACPTLVAVGREDQLTPLPRAEELAQGIGGARLTVFEDCGHLPPLERPEQTTAVLSDWLSW